jgi:hypothetical protein
MYPEVLYLSSVTLNILELSLLVQQASCTRSLEVVRIYASTSRVQVAVIAAAILELARSLCGSLNRGFPCTTRDA